MDDERPSEKVNELSASWCFLSLSLSRCLYKEKKRPNTSKTTVGRRRKPVAASSAHGTRIYKKKTCCGGGGGEAAAMAAATDRPTDKFSKSKTLKKTKRW